MFKKKSTIIPKIVKNHPEIEVVLDNIISSHYGLRLLEVLSMIGDMFSGLEQSDLEDEDFIRWVNHKLGKGTSSSSLDYSNIGKNHSNDIEHNEDPFAGLRPGR